MVENVDNSEKNNLRLRGLEEGAEGENVASYLEDLFSSCPGADYELIFINLIAY